MSIRGVCEVYATTESIFGIWGHNMFRFLRQLQEDGRLVLQFLKPLGCSKFEQFYILRKPEPWKDPRSGTSQLWTHHFTALDYKNPEPTPPQWTYIKGLMVSIRWYLESVKGLLGGAGGGSTVLDLLRGSRTAS